MILRAGAGLMGAACVAWAAAPLPRQGVAGFALFLAILGVAAGMLRLALAAVPVPEENYLLSVGLRAWLRFLELLRLVPWEEGAVAAILWLEVLHPARPWHTAVLGAALIAYLLATHLAESDTSIRVLRPQVRPPAWCCPTSRAGRPRTPAGRRTGNPGFPWSVAAFGGAGQAGR
ncbi:MAG: hypothetical protein M3Z75_05865 [Actinomycetota bacterium]|nr:hypothetical protein [Actinomycetota bacterium]